MNRDKQYIDEEQLIRFLTGETDERESVEVRKWIDLSAENRARFEKLRKIWIETDDPAKTEPALVNIDSAWQHLKNRMDQHLVTKSTPPANERSLFYYLMRAAAILIFGILIYSIYQHQSQHPEKILIASGEQMISDRPMPDGSIISLNRQTIMEHPEKFSKNERRVRISGEAFFKIKPDSTKPFIVEAQEAIITVLGTSFNVKALEQDKAVEVLVEEGHVQLSNTDLSKSVKLRIGEKGIYFRETAEVKKETEVDSESLFWLNKTLLFRDTELSTVFATLGRLYNVNIEVKDESILNCQLTAKFSNESIDHIMEHISTIFDFEIEKDGKIFLITGDGCR